MKSEVTQEEIFALRQHFGKGEGERKGKKGGAITATETRDCPNDKKDNTWTDGAKKRRTLDAVSRVRRQSGELNS